MSWNLLGTSTGELCKLSQQQYVIAEKVKHRLWHTAKLFKNKADECASLFVEVRFV